MKNTEELLRKLTERFPPFPGRSHAVVLSDDLKRGVLKLALSTDDTWQSVFLEREDLDKTPDVILEEIDGLLKTVLPGTPV